MATFKQRALTIATVGLLSGSPITIATNGLIQQAETPTPIPPVVETRRPAAGGITHLEYAHYDRIYSEFKWSLNTDLDVSHKTVGLTDAKHDSSLFYALDIEVTAQPATLDKAQSIFWYGLDTGFEVRTDSLPVIGYNGFSYALDISANVVHGMPTQAFWLSDTGLYGDIGHTARYIPVAPDQAIYSNIHFNDIGFEVTSQNRLIDSGLRTYQQVSDNAVGLDVLATHQSFTLFSSRYTESSELFTGFDYESYSYVEHAPIELLSEEEELFLMLAHILAEDDDA